MVSSQRRSTFKPAILKLSLTLVESTSIPLIVLMLLYLLTGYEMLVLSRILIPNARAIHTDRVLRLILVALVLIHGYFGTLILCERRIRNNLARPIIEFLITVALIFLVALIVLYEARIR